MLKLMKGTFIALIMVEYHLFVRSEMLMYQGWWFLIQVRIYLIINDRIINDVERVETEKGLLKFVGNGNKELNQKLTFKAFCFENGS